MSDHVIIVGVKRAKEYVPSNELSQMCGRIGRVQNGLSYSADIILTEDDFCVEESLTKDEKHNALSNFNDIQKFSFYVIPKIINVDIYNKDGIKSFFDKSFSAFQGGQIDEQKVIDYLVKNDAIAWMGDSFCATDIGQIAYQYYMSVGDVKKIKENFKKVIANDRDSDGAIAWALGNLETIKIHGDFVDHRHEMDNFLSDLPSDYFCEDGTVITSSLWWCMMGNGVPGKQMANNVRQLKKQFGRIRAVLKDLGYDKVFCDELETRIRRNVSRELLPFFSDPNMTKTRAAGLKWMGYNDAEGTEGIEIDE